MRFVPLLTDASGTFEVSTVNPGTGGWTLGVQCIVAAEAGGPFYGTSDPVALVLE